MVVQKSGVKYLSALQTGFAKGIPNIDFHLHTKFTDGLQSVNEMHHQGCDLLLEGILFSEHARKSSGDWFKTFASQIRLLSQTQCMAFVGAETRVVDYNGNVEIGQDIISQCDLVIGSVHRFPDINGNPVSFQDVNPQDALAIEYKLSTALLKNDAINILGHPFGMCYEVFGVIPPDDLMIKLIENTAKSHVAFEINSKYHSNPLQLLRWCRTLHAKMSIGSDAHSRDELGTILKVLQADR